MNVVLELATKNADKATSAVKKALLLCLKTVIDPLLGLCEYPIP